MPHCETHSQILPAKFRLSLHSDYMAEDYILDEGNSIEGLDEQFNERFDNLNDFEINI